MMPHKLPGIRCALKCLSSPHRLEVMPCALANPVIDGNKLTSLLGRKVRTRHMIALNKFSHTLNSHNLTPDLISTIIQSQDSLPNKPPESRCINNTMYAESTEVEHTPACWNWSKSCLEHAPPNPPTTRSMNVLLVSCQDESLLFFSFFSAVTKVYCKLVKDHNIASRGVYKGFTMVAYSPRLWLMAAGETSSTSIKN
eukprot:1159443-Pelagomonas_calceolata.AAC.9